MGEYLDHQTRTKERMQNLRLILDGKAPAINRAQFAWFVRNGLLIVTARHSHPAGRIVTGSPQAYAELGREPSDAQVVVYMQHGGYRMAR